MTDPDGRRRPRRQVVLFKPELNAYEATLAAARVSGCVCDPEIEIGPPPHVSVAHDPWCPIVRAGDVN